MEADLIFGGISAGYKALVLYLLVINLITFLVFGLDKYKAIHHQFRISVKTLMCLALVGGSAGGLLGMYIFRHKTRKPLFTVGIPIILIVQLILISFLLKL